MIRALALHARGREFESHILHMGKLTFEKGIDYYLENGKIIYTEQYLKRRGTCCGSGDKACRHCPFDPTHTKGNKNLREDLGKDLTDSE